MELTRQPEMRFKTQKLAEGHVDSDTILEAFRAYESHLIAICVPDEVRGMSSALVDPLPLALELDPAVHSVRIDWVTGTLPDGYFTTSVDYSGVSEQSFRTLEAHASAFDPSLVHTLGAQDFRRDEIDRDLKSGLLIHRFALGRQLDVWEVFEIFFEEVAWSQEPRAER